MKLFFIRLSLFITVTLIPLVAVNFIFTKRIFIAEFGKPLWAMNKFSEKYDFAVVGSSRAENIINVVLINDSAHLHGINIAHSGSAFHENYLTLSEFLNKNSVNAVLLSADFFGLIEQKKAYSKPFHEYYFIPYLKNDIIYSGVKKEVGPLKAFTWKYLPLVGYFEYNNIYSLNQLFSKRNKKAPVTTNLGYEPVPEFQKINFAGNRYEDSYYVTDSTSLSHLDKIIALCREKKVKLFFYSAPIYTPCFEHMKGGREGQQQIDSAAAKNHIPFFDLVNCEISEDTLLFKDNTHLNRKGSDKFSLKIGDSLRKYLQLKTK